MSYDAFASTFSESRKNLRWGEIEYFVEYMKKNFSGEKISILDVGCGNGRFLETLETSELPYLYLGIDASVGMINEAKKLHPEQSFQVLDMNRLEALSDNEKYQFIVFIASFHHLHTKQERKEVLEKTKKLLSPGGVIMVTNWNLLGEELFSKYQESYKGNGDFSIKIGAYERYYHGFTLEELDSLFLESGYKVLENRIFESGKNIVSILTT
ncbi:MAG: methyltransferase domain-containing protein [Candidatus Gracilibacteria bacterium]|nr:methyltransferase domain-containing protein [Candidatus Gracilibacteria bacterium]